MKKYNFLFFSFMLIFFNAITIKAIDFEYDGLFYTIESFSERTVTVKDLVNSDQTNIIIPESVEYEGQSLKVTKIGKRFLYQNINVKNISINANLSSIESQAFYGCSSLINVNFINCTNFGDSIFSHCINLVEINLPDNLSTIGAGTFKGCRQLLSIRIPNNITTIDTSCFEGCTNIKDILFSDNIVKIGDCAFRDCNNFILNELPINLTDIGTNAFEGCNSITQFYIPDSVKSIGNNAFNGCDNIDVLSIGAGIISIDENLWGCKKTNTLEFRYGKGKLSCKAGTKIKSSETWTGNFQVKSFYGAFYDLNIKNLIINRAIVYSSHSGSTNNYSYSYEAPFCRNQYIKNIFIGETGSLEPQTSVVSNLFEECSELEIATIIGSYKMDNGIFLNCINLKELNLEKEKIIRSKALDGCLSLTQLILPETFTTLQCTLSDLPLEKLILLCTNPPSFYNSCFSENQFLKLPVFVPYGCREVYLSDPAWNNFWNIEEMPGVDAEQIVLNMDYADINIGETVQLEATVLPENTTDKSLSWNSSDPNIATVSENGLVTAIAAGTVIITATCGEVSASCEVTVKRAPVERIELTSYEIDLGEEEWGLTATIYPETAGGTKISWSTSNDLVKIRVWDWTDDLETCSKISINRAGTESGVCEVTATAGDLSATCVVNVLPDAGVESLLANPDTKISIYTTDGILLKKDCKVDDLKTLNKGIYIIVSGKEHYKISI